MKRQKQIDASKQMIASAFFRLLQKYDFNEITLTEIADHAGVTRMTLYRHFRTKEKIILYVAQKSLEQIKARIPDSNNSMKELLFHRLELIKNLPHVSILLRSREIEEILNQFRMATFKERFEQLVGHRYQDDPYIFHFYFGGINSMIREWLKNNCRESSREMIDRIISISRALTK